MIKKQFYYLTLAPSLLLSAASCMAGPPPPAEVRDYLYCELVLTATVNSVTTHPVFNTIGYQTSTPGDSCPDWASQTPQQVIAAYNADPTYTGGATSVAMNLPRHFVMDSVVESGASTNDILWVGATEYGYVANLTTPPQPVYVVTTVQRNSTWTYKKGTLVYELTDPLGNTYVMQSYTTLVDPSLTLRKLSHIGPKDQLPAGWKYKARRLKAELNLTAAGSTQIVNDYFRNTFQINPNAHVQEQEQDKD